MNRGARRMRRAAGRPRPGTLVDRNQLKGNVFHGFEIPPPTAKAARVFCAVRSLFLGLPRTLVSGPPPPGIEKRPNRIAGGFTQRRIAPNRWICRGVGRQVRAARRLVEQVDRRAFNKSTAGGCPGVLAHSDDYLLGTTGAGTLRLNIDERGLLDEVDVPECRSDTLEMVSRGEISKNSFAFQCFEDEWAYWNGQPLRNLFPRRLIDVAPVNMPAYLDSSAGLPSLARFVDVPVEEIIDLHIPAGVRKLFTRTSDRSMRPTGRNPHQALVEMQAKRWGNETKPSTGKMPTSRSQGRGSG